MWFVFALITVICWGGSDLFFKISSPEDDRFSHWRIVMAVGTVMGVHATVQILTGTVFHPVDFWRYLPASGLYIASMIFGYVGMRYLMLSVLSPLCNTSGAVSCLLCLLFLNQRPDALTWTGIALVMIGMLGLAVVEKAQERAAKPLSADETAVRSGLVALLFPVVYCVLDGLGTFADALLLDTGRVEESSANIAYEYSFAILAVFAYIYVGVFKKQRLSLRNAPTKLLGSLCETAGQFTYIYALSERAVVVAPMVSAYCAFSVLFSRVFLKEKLSVKQYLAIGTVFFGILLMGVAEGLAE